jgi:hypothetical protein
MTATQVASLAPVPTPAAVRETLQMMVGRTVLVTDAGWAPPEGAEPVAIASFIDDDDVLLACAWVDLAGAAALGAAMSMLPTTRLEEMLLTGELDEEVYDNLHETFNIASSLLNTDTSLHLRIRELERTDTGIYEDVLGLLGDPRVAGYYQIDVDEYGGGILSFTLS